MTNQEKREIFLGYFDKLPSLTGECNARIEQCRKGDARLSLPGVPDGVEVEIRQVSHSFKYGANIFMLDEFEHERENLAYRELFAKYFNLATVPFYWDGLEPERGKPRYAKGSPKVYRRPAPDLCVDYCRERGILPKLHCFFYDKFTPDWLPRQDEAAMREVYTRRMREIAERYRDVMVEFEITNEMLESEDWEKKSILTDLPDTVEWCFRLARRELGDSATLVINEGTSTIGKLLRFGEERGYTKQIADLLAVGAPIDKIGVQNHIFAGVHHPDGESATREELAELAESFLDPEKHLAMHRAFAKFGRPTEITEVTLPTLGDTPEDEELQAELLRRMYTLWFSIPEIETVVYWNTVDHTAYVTPGWNENNCRAGLFHRDLTPKKSADMLYDLFHRVWHTETTATVENGEVTFRGFYGDYEIRVGDKIIPFALKKN